MQSNSNDLRRNFNLLNPIKSNKARVSKAEALRYTLQREPRASLPRNRENPPAGKRPVSCQELHLSSSGLSCLGMGGSPISVGLTFMEKLERGQAG